MGYFTAENYKEGMTMGLCVIIVGSIVFQDSVESVFSLPTALSLVSVAAFCPPFSGFSILLYPIILVGMIIAWINYYIVLYITYAVIGPDFSPRTEKGITLVVVATVMVALLHLMRVRLPILDAPGNLGQLLPNVFIFILYWSSRDPEVKSQWQIIALMFIPIIIGTIVSIFIIPHPAGQSVLGLLGQLLNATAELQNSVTKKLLLAEVDQTTGKMESNKPFPSTDVTSPSPAALEAGTEIKNGMQEGKYLGIASELEPVVIPIHKLDIQAWQLVMGIDMLSLLSALEFDVYNKPHIFPKKEFRAVLTPVRTIEHLYIKIAGFLQNGQVPMRAFPLLRNELEEVRAAVEMSFSTLKHVIVDRYEYGKGLMECAPRAEAACLNLKSKLEQNEKAAFQGGNNGGYSGATSNASGVGSDDLIVARELTSLVLLAGKELRTAWEKVPALIASRQPEAGAVAESYFSANKMNSGDSDGNVAGYKENGRSSGSPQLQSTTARPPAIPPSTVLPPSSAQPEFRQVIKSIPSCSALRLKLYNASVRTGIHAWHLKMVLHVAIVFAVAATLCVIPAADDALGKHAYWIIINIFATTESTTVSIVDTCWQRILGTAIGTIGVAATAGFGYLANGKSYTGHNTACRVTQVAFTCIWMSVARMFQAKYSPRYYRLFFIATFLPPLIALLDSEGSDVWPNIEWRLANTCIGIALNTLVSIVIFPVAAEDPIRQKTAECLLHIANMLDEISVLPLSLAPDSSDSSFNKRDGCFGQVRRRKSSASTRQAPELELDRKSTAGTKNDPRRCDDLKEATAAVEVVLENAPEYVKQHGGGDNVNDSNEQKEGAKEEDPASLAAKVIISNGIQKAGKSLMDVIKLRNIVDKEYFVSKIWYKCFNRRSAAAAAAAAAASSSQDKSSVDQQQRWKLGGCFKSRPPMKVYHLDQLISHLKNNIDYSNIALYVREWLRSQTTIFAKRPEVAVAVRAFSRQTAECFKALRLAILKLVTPKEALKTVLNLRNMAEDIGAMCNTSENIGPEEATIVHTLLITCRNVEFLYRAIDRALVTRDEPGVVSIADQELQSGVSMLSLLNLKATVAAVQAVEMGEESAAAENEKKGAAAVARNGVNLFG